MKYFANLGKLFFKGEKNSFIRLFSLLFLVFIVVNTIQGQALITHNIGTQGNLVIPGNSTNNYIITGSTTTNTVTINPAYNGNITLRNLSITKSSGAGCITVLGEYNRSNLNPTTKVNIILEGANTLTYTGSTYCAFQVDQGAQIHISSIDPNDNTKGTLVARTTTTSGGAAIGAPNSSVAQGVSVISGSCGSNQKTAGGNILISSGTITAWGGHGAGIGGGYQTYYNGIIAIYGGVIEAHTLHHAAGIGSGCPNGSGVQSCYADNSAIIALPPAQITAFGRGMSTTPETPTLGLAGARNITYINDPNKPLITVQTEDNEPNANIYLDLTETPGLVDIFDALEINYDLKKVQIGKTNATGILTFNGRFEQNTTFFTDASSSKPATFGRPYMPVKKTVLVAETIVLPLLTMDIAFTDYPSTPLEVGYTVLQAKQHAYRLKMEYKDTKPMTAVTFRLQDLGVDFLPMTFYSSDGTTVASTPTTLNAGDIYYIDLPIKHGKPMGIYFDILQIHGNWNGAPLPGPIRRVGEQRVVYNDTNINNNIKVTASPNKFVETFPTAASVNLTLNINHAGNSIVYNPLDVNARYLVTTELDYDTALVANPLNTWSLLNVPVSVSINTITPVSFNGKAKDTYYIHWYVTSGVVYAHSGSITVPPRPYGGFGPYIIADPVTAGVLKGNPYVCSGQIPQTIKGDASNGGSGDFSYQWQISTNGSTWSNVGNDSPNYTPAALAVSPTYYRRITTDKQYGGTYNSNIFTISIVNGDQTLYWKKAATNKNWNDPGNWVDVNGVALNRVPVSCSNVFITSGAANYPSLKPEDTPTDIYGLPACYKITFAYGAELAYQQNLNYELAYVQYNFGKYDGSYNLNTSDSNNSPNYMLRNRWYILAAPLKGMASGDFSMAGYPFTWQAGHNKVSLATDGMVALDKSTFPTNDVKLSDNYNSLALKVAGYESTTVGYKDHLNLQGLGGIVNMPYFETLPNQYLPGQDYDHLSKNSVFYYFNAKTLQQLSSPIGKVKRGSEAYRFVYENDITNQADLIAVPGEGTTVKGYKLTVTAPQGSGNKVLIGNPFLASINMSRFIQVNGNVIDENARYQVYNSSNHTWQTNSYTSGNNVGSFQSFIVTLKNNSAELLFPLEGQNALTGSSSAGVPGGFMYSMYVTMSDSEGNGGEAAILTPSSSSNIRKLVSLDKGSVPEVFFVDGAQNNKNLLQVYHKGLERIDIGVKIPVDVQEVTLKFDSVGEFMRINNVRPKLIDRSTGVVCDLTKNNRYTFINQIENKDVKDYQYVNTKRLYISFTDPSEDETPESIKIYYSEGNLSVISGNILSSVQVFSINGQHVFSDRKLPEQNIYRKSVSLTPGVYIVEAETISKTKKQEKIIVR